MRGARFGWGLAAALAVTSMTGGGPVAPATLSAQPTGQPHVLIVTGIPGEPRFAEAFHTQARTTVSTSS
jgi:hypothetical protein